MTCSFAVVLSAKPESGANNPGSRSAVNAAYGNAPRVIRHYLPLVLVAPAE